MVRKAQSITLALILLSFCRAAEFEPASTNREIILRLCDRAMTDIAAGNLQQFRSVFVTTGSDLYAAPLLQQFVQGLSSRQVPVFLKIDSSEASLELSVMESSVRYSTVFTESFFGSRKMVRTVTLNMLGTCVSRSDGKVAWSKPFSHSVTDTVFYADRERLNEGSFPLTSINEPELSFFDILLEPAIVTIASGVAIYLFFTIRS